MSLNKEIDRNFAYELTGVIMNVVPLYKQLCSIETNMSRKLMRGTYDFGKSIVGFRYVADAANSYYKREFGDSTNVPTRNYAAFLLAYGYAEQNEQMKEMADIWAEKNNVFA